MLQAWIIRLERLVKGALFGCRMCGQCLLSRTSLVCPMTCPKGLRQGPCGGTLDGKCEVFPEKPCTWVRIHVRDASAPEAGPMPVYAPFDPTLLDTSSLLNHLRGADRATCSPLPFPRSPGESPTGSRLEATLRAGRRVITAEIRSPRTEKGMGRVRSEIAALSHLVDALNATSHHGGHRTLSATEVARLVAAAGCEPIPQVCGRDVDPEGFRSGLEGIRDLGARNVLCLTGDWPQGGETGFFRMDSAQMLREASASGLFAGAVINPSSSPREVVLSRLDQKLSCGAGFLQTQVVTDLSEWEGWIRDVQKAGFLSRAFVLASVPVVGSPGGLEVLGRLPGVRLSDGARSRLERAADLRDEGTALAEELVSGILGGPAHGIHLMNFGADTGQVARVAGFARERMAAEGIA